MSVSDNTNQKKKLLYEVSLIRPFVIFLLVVLHSFTKIEAGGLRTSDYQLPEIYRWLCHFISGFRIETIALVAGYVFAYQSLDLQRKYALKPFVFKKFKRLILPMLFFGIFYYAFFLYKPETFTVGGFLMAWFSGCGHLWFLPMLFWCFMAIWAIDHFCLSSWKTLVVLALVAILPLPFYRLPLGFSRLPHFLFFVYGGFFLWQHRQFVLQRGLSLKAILLLWLAYVVLVIMRHTVMGQPPEFLSPTEMKVWNVMLRAIDLIISCIGIMSLYCTISRKTICLSYTPKNWVIRSSDYCYGVYVAHQFLLVWLYHYTPIVSNLSPYFTPWIGLAFAFSVSWCLTNIFLRTRLGRLLIG